MSINEEGSSRPAFIVVLLEDPGWLSSARLDRGKLEEAESLLRETKALRRLLRQCTCACTRHMFVCMSYFCVKTESCKYLIFVE